MREESHLDDMRSALRGDFERLAERRGGQELMRPLDEPAEEPPPAPSEDASPEPEQPAPEPETELAAEHDVDTFSEPPPELESPAEDDLGHEALGDDLAAEEPTRRSWLDRLLGR